MERSVRFLAAASSALLALPFGAFGAAFVYEVQEGSFIRDACETCDRAPFEEPVRGRLTLTLAPVGPPEDRYEISDIEISSASGSYAISGSGSYEVAWISPPTQTMALDAVVNGIGGIRLLGGPEELFALRPAIAIEVAEQEPHRDPLHIYTLRLLAAPKAAETIAYELVDGSTYQDCLPCMKPPILVPLSGGFALSKIDENPLFTAYRVDGIDFWDTKGDFVLRISGSGSYRFGGEVALVQEMRLEVRIEQGETTRSGVLLANLEAAPEARFPEISIQLEHRDPFPWYSIRLVARPKNAEPRFRRGDANCDGAVDVADAIYLLLWRFAGGETPSCLDAADADGSGAHDLSDPVSILAYLFRGGEAPPAPGPTDCAAAPESFLGCARYPPCPASGF